MTSRSSPPVPNPRQSLQGLLTKDVTPLLKQDAAPVYAALLNSKGRMVHDLILHRDESVGRRHTAIFVDCPATTLEQLKANLVRFKLRSHVTIEDASPDLTIVARWSRGLPSISDCNLPAPPDLPADPRHTQLGARGPVVVTGGGAQGDPPYSGVMLGIHGTDEETYRGQRYLLGIAEGPAEIPPGNALPLEYNIELLQGVSFDKGCYLGQELVARTHYQGLVRKRVLPVRLDPAHSAAQTEAYIGADVLSPKMTRPVGTIRGVSGAQGIAHLRLQETWEVVKQKQTLYAEVDSVRVTVQPLVPDWWPGALKPSSLCNVFF